MNRTRIYRLLFIFITLMLLATGFLLEKRYYSTKISELDLQKIQHGIQFKGNQLNLIANYMLFLLENGENDKYESIHDGVKTISLEFNHIVLVYKNNQLIYWSDNKVAIPETMPRKWMNESFTRLSNGWYLCEYAGKRQYDVFVLSAVKNEYEISNKFLINSFVDGINPSTDVNIIIDPTIISTAIYDTRGNYIFSLSSPEEKPISYKTWPVVLFYLLGLILFSFIFVFQFVKQLNYKWHAYLMVFFILATIRYLLLRAGVPRIFYDIDLFKPYVFAASVFLPSLGDFLMHLFFLLPVFFAIHRRIKRIYLSELSSVKRKLVFSALAALVVLTIHLAYTHVIVLFGYNSTIQFELYGIFDISPYTLFALLIFMLLSLLAAVVYDLVFIYLRKSMRFGPFILVYLLGSAFLWFFNLLELNELIVLSFLVVGFVYCRFVQRKFNQRSLIVLIILFSLFSSYKFYSISKEKEIETMQLRSLSIGSERDYIAELLFDGLSEQVETNKRIRHYIANFAGSSSELSDYLLNRVYNGYFERYDLQYVLCDSLTNLYMEETSLNTNCYDFFSDMIYHTGISLEEPGFYFLNNSNGRISYLNTFEFEIDGDKIRLLVELDSKFESEETGYPDLLIQGEISESNKRKRQFSSAKYVNGDLYSQTGEITFPLVFDFILPTDSSDLHFLNIDKVNYCIYEKNNNEYIVLAKKESSVFDVLTNFTYFFIIYYLSFVLGNLVYRIIYKKQLIGKSFRSRIIVPFISVLLLAFIVIAVSIYLYVYYEFERKNISIIKEKVSSVQIEMLHEIGNEGAFYANDDNSYVYYVLARLSNVFNTDINFYDKKGCLINSSREEVFDKGLVGKRMNAEAWVKMSSDKLIEFIQKESVGNLEYFSIYVPFINNFGEKTGYLNLPYFSKQSALKDEINKLFAAALNIYILLVFISVLAALFVSTQIVKPLKLIRDKLKLVRLGRKNELIYYRHKDEIGFIIQEYNRMVEELEVSLKKVADSEREMAWREMARQIAHEIKNPLTPMKLRLQYLKRAWDQNEEDFDQRFNRFVEMMGEQIESLSAIASSFSNFAKFEEPKNERINISEKVSKILELYEENNLIHFEKSIVSNLYVFIDPEQFGRVIINLVKNAMQAIESKKEGRISLSLEKEGDWVQFKIADNGKGIPEDIKDKIFKPNFTTKSSGMGLGLAISKKIIEQAGGEISFSSIINTGTIFYIKLPVFKSN